MIGVRDNKIYKVVKVIDKFVIFAILLILIIDNGIWRYIDTSVTGLIVINLLISVGMIFNYMGSRDKLTWKPGLMLAAIFAILINFINCSFNPQALVISQVIITIYIVTVWVGEIWDARVKLEKETVIQKYKNLATTDRLTGVLNKEASKQEVNKAIKNSKYGAFFMIDLDNFKSVNDNFGHAFGDKVLVEVSDKLNLIFTKDDVIGRIGGDEFIVFVKSYSGGREWISAKAEQLNKRIRKEYEQNGMVIQVSSSIGVALYPENGTDFDLLYKMGDKAMYNVKHNTKNGYAIV